MHIYTYKYIIHNTKNAWSRIRVDNNIIQITKPIFTLHIDLLSCSFQLLKAGRRPVAVTSTGSSDDKTLVIVGGGYSPCIRQNM